MKLLKELIFEPVEGTLKYLFDAADGGTGAVYLLMTALVAMWTGIIYAATGADVYMWIFKNYIPLLTVGAIINLTVMIFYFRYSSNVHEAPGLVTFVLYSCFGVFGINLGPIALAVTAAIVAIIVGIVAGLGVGVSKGITQLQSTLKRDELAKEETEETKGATKVSTG